MEYLHVSWCSSNSVTENERMSHSQALRASFTWNVTDLDFHMGSILSLIFYFRCHFFREASLNVSVSDNIFTFFLPQRNLDLHEGLCSLLSCVSYLFSETC